MLRENATNVGALVENVATVCASEEMSETFVKLVRRYSVIKVSALIDCNKRVCLDRMSQQLVPWQDVTNVGASVESHKVGTSVECSKSWHVERHKR